MHRIAELTGESSADDISVVIPTYNRAEALRANLFSFLDLEEVMEIVLVLDARSSDDTATVVSRLGDPRVRLVRPGRSGQPALRNAGVDATAGAWVLFGEDDCRVPPDYAVRLRREARSHDAAVVGAAWLHIDGSAVFADEFERARAHPAERPALDAPGGVPGTAVVTPFMPALYLVRRDVFDHVRFDEGYVGNAFREETDFLVAAIRAGYCCVLSPDTASYQVGQWPGGARTSRLRYEWLAARNNWRFLQRHRDWLEDNREIRSPLTAQAAFLRNRARQAVKGSLVERVARWRA
jgi:GT2 family glycosyltransferase